jgi:hypothetical protein
MPKAIQHPTTPPPAAPLPSILDLCRRRLALSNGLDRLEAARADTTNRAAQISFETAETLSYDQQNALSDLMTTFPAVTIGDAAAQLCVAWLTVSTLENFDIPRTERDKLVLTLRRITLSVLPVVASAAGLDLAEIAEDYLVDSRAREFPDLGVVS